MSKKIKPMNRNNARFEMDLPEVVDIDTLSYASDPEIRGRHDYLDQDRARAIQAGYDPTPWEVELAYVQREVDIRRKRMIAHEKYMRSNPDVVSSDFVDSTVDTDRAFN